MIIMFLNLILHHLIIKIWLRITFCKPMSNNFPQKLSQKMYQKHHKPNIFGKNFKAKFYWIYQKIKNQDLLEIKFFRSLSKMNLKVVQGYTLSVHGKIRTMCDYEF